jgi:hypothetical protein
VSEAPPLVVSRPTPPPPAGRTSGKVATDVLVVLAAAALLGILIGLLWPQLADPVTVVRTENGLVRDEVALAEQFDALGWFSVLSAVGGALLGAVMLAWRRTDEVATLVAVVAGAFLAAWLAARVGLAVGPGDPAAALAEAAEGDTAPAALALGTGVVYWVMPLFATLGALLFLLSPLAEPDVSRAAEGAPPSRP